MEQRFQIEETLWTSCSAVVVPKRTRYDLARTLKGAPLYLKAASFLDLVCHCWDRETMFEAFLGNGNGSLMTEIERYLIRNPEDWTTENFFERVGAFQVSDRCFSIFIKELTSVEVLPDEASQRKFVAVVNAVELREVDTDEGFSVFRFANVGHSTFATR